MWSIVVVVLLATIDVDGDQLTPDLTLDAFLEILWQTTECDDFLSDIDWVAISTFECFGDDDAFCNYPSEVCMEKTNSFDKHRQCRQLPIECVTAANGGIAPESMIELSTDAAPATTIDETSTIDSLFITASPQSILLPVIETRTTEISPLIESSTIPSAVRRLNHDICKLERDLGETGPGCYRSYIYYFDYALSTCKPMIYFGCGGNANKFINQRECQNACENHFVKLVSSTTTIATTRAVRRRLTTTTLPLPSTTIPPLTPPSTNALINVCNLDKPVGDGQCPYILMFYYNRQTGQCEQFYFPGCRTAETNANLFQTNQQCVYAATACKLIGQNEFLTQLTTNWNRVNWLEKIQQIPALITSTLTRKQPIADIPIRRSVAAAAPTNRQVSVSIGKDWSAESTKTIDDRRICRLRRAIGHQRCANGKLSQRYYYTMTFNECRPFWFLGCNGNRNSFDSLSSCRQLCIVNARNM